MRHGTRYHSGAYAQVFKERLYRLDPPFHPVWQYVVMIPRNEDGTVYIIRRTGWGDTWKDAVTAAVTAVHEVRLEEMSPSE